MLDPNPKRPLNRVNFVVLGITAIGLGLAPLRHGHLFYPKRVGWDCIRSSGDSFRNSVYTRGAIQAGRFQSIIRSQRNDARPF